MGASVKGWATLRSSVYCGNASWPAQTGDTPARLRPYLSHGFRCEIAHSDQCVADKWCERWQSGRTHMYAGRDSYDASYPVGADLAPVRGRMQAAKSHLTCGPGRDAPLSTAHLLRLATVLATAWVEAWGDQPQRRGAIVAATRTKYEVVPTGTCWEIKRDGKDFLAVQTKQVAVDEAVYQASRSEPSHVTVKRLDGGIEEEADFGAGEAREPKLTGSLKVDTTQPHEDMPRKAAS